MNGSHLGTPLAFRWFRLLALLSQRKYIGKRQGVEREKGSATNKATAAQGSAAAEDTPFLTSTPRPTGLRSRSSPIRHSTRRRAT